MTERKLYWSNILVDLFTLQLEKIETLEGGWSTRYLDKKTGKEWLKYTIDESGSSYNLIPYNPLLSTEELLDIAFKSNDSDEVKAAAYRLYYEEFYEKKECRKKILARIKTVIETSFTNSENDRLTNIILIARLLDNVNHSEIVDKHYTEIEEDAKYYQESANEAKSLLDFLYSGNNS
jgi:hypothetical protein